jgi:hypothetical protein
LSSNISEPSAANIASLMTSGTSYSPSGMGSGSRVDEVVLSGESGVDVLGGVVHAVVVVPECAGLLMVDGRDRLGAHDALQRKRECGGAEQ